LIQAKTRELGHFRHFPTPAFKALCEVIQFLSIRGRSLPRKPERKVKAIIADPKARIGDEAKKRR
jgi:hypothetical protein